MKHLLLLLGLGLAITSCSKDEMEDKFIVAPIKVDVITTDSLVTIETSTEKIIGIDVNNDSDFSDELNRTITNNITLINGTRSNGGVIVNGKWVVSNDLTPDFTIYDGRYVSTNKSAYAHRRYFIFENEAYAGLGYPRTQGYEIFSSKPFIEVRDSFSNNWHVDTSIESLGDGKIRYSFRTYQRQKQTTGDLETIEFQRQDWPLPTDRELLQDPEYITKGVYSDEIYGAINYNDPLSFFKAFKLDAERHGVDLSYLIKDNFIFKLTDTVECFGGICATDTCNRNTANIKWTKESWENYSRANMNNQKLMVFYHEMGHSALGYDHNTGRQIMSNDGGGYGLSWYNGTMQQALNDFWDNINQVSHDCKSSKNGNPFVFGCDNIYVSK